MKGLVDPPKPPDPYNLIGEHWCEMSASELFNLGTHYTTLATGVSQAEQKTYNDALAWEQLLPEGFDAQRDAILEVGRMHGSLAAWLITAANDITLCATDLAQAKAFTVSAVQTANKMIATAIAAIAFLQMWPGTQSELEIAALRRQIKSIEDAARETVKALYNGIQPPQGPLPPAITKPLVYNGPPIEGGPYTGQPSEGGPGGAVPAKPAGGGQPGDRAPQAGQPYERAPGAQQQPTPGSHAQQAGDRLPAPPAHTSPPSGSPPTGLMPGSASPLGKSPISPPFGSLPSPGGLGSGGMPGGVSPAGFGGNGLSGLSSGAAGPGSAASGSPAQQFLSGAAQGLASPAASSPLAAGSASTAASSTGQRFNPPPGATMPAGPPPVSEAAPPSTSAAPQVSVPATTATGGGSGVPGGSMPLAAPPPAGVPNPPPAPAPPAPPPAPAAPVAGGGGGSPGPVPPAALRLGATSAAFRAAQMGSNSYGEGHRATPEFGAAMSLVAALNDPDKPPHDLLLGGWSCAVFGAGDSVRFVVADRHGLSWIPAGVFMPAGVTVAHLDEAVPAELRLSWRGLEPSALVLSQYARAVGERPRIVVARAYDPGLDGWFDRGTTVVADEGQHVIIPNPLLDPAGRHRLLLASPGDWDWVQSVPDSDVYAEVRRLAAWVVDRHNEFFTEQWHSGVAGAEGAQAAGPDARLRSAALAQIGRGGEPAAALAAAIKAKMVSIVPLLFGCPSYHEEPGRWRSHTELEMQLRGWETLLLGLRPPTHATLADMWYAAMMATQPVVPPAGQGEAA